jgi:hypothetical protein
MNKDKVILWGAVAVMAATASFSFWRISHTPIIDPTIEKLIGDLTRIEKGPMTHPAPPSPPGVPPLLLGWARPAPARGSSCVISDPLAPAPPWTACIRPVALGVPLPHPRTSIRVLPIAVMSRPRADLSGTTISWTLRDPDVQLSPWMDRKNAAPEGFVVWRQRAGGAVETLATLGPQARSYADLSTEPLQTYRYWVAAGGQESDLSLDPPVLRPVSKGDPAGMEVRTPSAERVRLVGGDLAAAVLRVETYDRKEMKWIARTVMASPGRRIGSAGWTLNGLSFDKFTLEAHVTDEDGIVHVLTTKD